MAPDAVMLAAGLTGTFSMNGLPLSAIATKGLRGRITAIIPAVEVAWRQVVHLFFTMNRSCLADCHMDWSQNTSTAAPHAD